MNRRLLALAAVGLLVTLAACGGSQPASTPTLDAAPTAAATATAAAMPTAAASEPAGPGGEPSPGSAVEPINLVILANSGGWGVAPPYAALAAEALGRDVRVQEKIVSGVGPNSLLSGIRGLWADDVADAGIIVLIVSPIGVTPASHLPCIPLLSGQTGEPPAATSVEDWQDLRDALDQIYDEIWRLRAGQPTIIRVVGSFNPWLGTLRQAGIASLCMANEDVRDQVERDAAEAAGAVFVSWLDLFNGPAHDVDPAEQGWLADGVHPNDTGLAVLVEALAASGWEVSQPR